MTDPARLYHVDLFFSEEDDCWIANASDLEYCSAHGETMEEAAREMRTAMELWLDVWLEDHDALPPVKHNSHLRAAG